MLAVMFSTFLLQILFRYVLNLPIGWTHELSAILWLWLVLWGAAFVLREAEEIRFDLLYGAAGPRLRRVMTMGASLGLVLLYGTAFPAVFDYVTFMRVESTAYLEIRFDWLFSIYLLFAAAAIVRHLWLCWRALCGAAPDASDPVRAGSGV